MYKFKVRLNQDIRKLDYKQAEEKIKSEFLKESSYLEVPLMKKVDLSKWSTLTTDGFRKAVGN